ncbi:Carbonic anhydrase, alpha class [hydrothermal vent metagenome]|uniref:carbonic anhydrase n=1 Tax=hydrothermal vent metagenome TaxID=652676 RepID=A0A3B0WY86_9ZZZZ
MKKNNHWLNIYSVLVILNSISFTNISYAVEIPFAYSGDNNAANWGNLTPEWAECSGASIEARQSPVNIHHVKIDTSLKPLYLTTYPTDINIFNNGHTIEQEYEDTGSHIYFEGTEYELKQFHFHTLSEHAINKKRGAIEMHAVFNEPVNHKNLVMSVIYELGRRKNHFIQTLIDVGLPKKNGDSTESERHINLADGFTDTSSYYTYSGSLTTPPCTGNVTWVVLKKIAKLSWNQWVSFRDILGNNFRPLQEINGRTIRSTSRKHHEKHHH